MNEKKKTYLILFLIGSIIAFLPIIFWQIEVSFGEPDTGTGAWAFMMYLSIPAGCGFFILSTLIAYANLRNFE